LEAKVQDRFYRSRLAGESGGAGGGANGNAQRLLGVSGAGAVNVDEEHTLIEAERNRESDLANQGLPTQNSFGRVSGGSGGGGAGGGLAQSQPNPGDYELRIGPVHALDSGVSTWVRKSDGQPASSDVVKALNRQIEQPAKAEPVSQRIDNGMFTDNEKAGDRNQSLTKEGYAVNSVKLNSGLGITTGDLEAPKNLGEEYRREVASSGGVVNTQAGTSAISLPAEKVPVVAFGDAGQSADAFDLSKTKSPDSLAASGQRQSQMRATGAFTANMDVDSDKSTLGLNGRDSFAMNGTVDQPPARDGQNLNDLAAENKSYTSVNGQSVKGINFLISDANAPALASSAKSDFSGKTEEQIKDQFSHMQSRQMLVEDRKFAPAKPVGSVGGEMLFAADDVSARLAGDKIRAVSEGSDNLPVLGDTPATGRMFASSTVAQSVASPAPVVTAAPVSGPVANAFAKDDVGGLRYVMQNSASAAQQPDEARKNLEQLKELHKLLLSKIEAEKLDATIPKTRMVQVVEQAEPVSKQTFWQGLKGEYASTARIKVENDINDSPGGYSLTAAQSGYDPYFIQTTFEIMQSDLVLGRVVDDLKLDEAWSKNNGGQKLKKSEAIAQLKKRLELKPVRNTKLIEIGTTSSNPEEAAKIANAVADAYQAYRLDARRLTTAKGIEVLEGQYLEESNRIQQLQAEVDKLQQVIADNSDKPLPKVVPNAPIPQPEVLCRENNFSTFSLNVSDVSFKLAAASLERGQMPDAASIRTEEFINAFDYRDPEAAAGQPLAFASERARSPFAQNRDLLRFSVKTAAAGRAAGRPLNLVLLLDNSGSMERADRVAIIREALHVLTAQLQPQDTVSVVTFARTARLWADGLHGDQAGETLARVGGITPEGGTNLEEAMRLAYETARRHYLANGMNRVVLLTDGAANLGDVSPADLKQKVEAQRQQGIALDCFGIGFEDYNDDLLEQLSSNGDGRYAFLNSPEDAAKEFATKLAGALQVAAQDVKVQVEFNPQRVVSWRQIGYAKHQLTKEQFRDNTVDAAEIAAQEAGNALYTVETKADGIGPIATVHVRYKVPGTTDYRERSWDVAYAGNPPALEQASPAMRLAATASAFSEWLAASPFAQEVTPDELLKTLSGVPQVYGADPRPKQLETMLREAKSVSGK
jgi:Mg-chelatase subunit ChlD/capsular polysaccharide biosynthesis protein